MDKSQILELLKKIRYPGYSRDIVSFGLVGNITITNGKAIITMKYTTQSQQVQEEIEKRIKEKLQSLTQIKEIEIKREMQKARYETMKKKFPAKYTIAIASGKGGVGKSSVTAILAVALSNLSYKVGIIDADVYGPSIPLILGIHETPELEVDNKISVPSKNNIKVISIGLVVRENEAVIWRGPMIYKALEQFLFQCNWGQLDFLLVDLPPGTGDAPLSLAQLGDITGVIIVSTPQKAAVDVAKKAIFMFQKLQTKIIGIIENMSYFQCNNCGKEHYLFGTGLVEYICKLTNTPLLGKLPIDRILIELADKGQLDALPFQAPHLYREYLKITKTLLNFLGFTQS
ncbi:MAG: P-loop NTPase [Planctomycetota bacterium]